MAALIKPSARRYHQFWVVHVQSSIILALSSGVRGPCYGNLLNRCNIASEKSPDFPMTPQMTNVFHCSQRVRISSGAMGNRQYTLPLKVSRSFTMSASVTSTQIGSATNIRKCTLGRIFGMRRALSNHECIPTSRGRPRLVETRQTHC